MRAMTFFAFSCIMLQYNDKRGGRKTVDRMRVGASRFVHVGSIAAVHFSWVGQAVQREMHYVALNSNHKAVQLNAQRSMQREAGWTLWRSQKTVNCHACTKCTIDRTKGMVARMYHRLSHPEA